MLVDALLAADGYLKISSLSLDPSQFWKVPSTIVLYFVLIFGIIYSYLQYFKIVHLFDLQLDDTILKTIETADKKQLKESRDIIRRIRRRDLYQVATCMLYVFLHLPTSQL